MGIRFFCPNGHKLNVKAELAGKVGICPKCGERMLIPLISTRKSGESRHIPQDENYSESPVAMSPPSPEISDSPSPQNVSGMENGNETAAALPGTDANEWESAQATQTSAIPLVDSSPAQTPFAAQGVWNTPEQDAVGTAAQVVDHATPTAPQTEAFSSSSMLNDPNVNWYVRTSDNQSYGPATLPVIQSWIQEKRIGPHMLVWREGWASWLEAGNVFPELEAAFASQAADSFPTSPVNTRGDSPVVVSSSASDEKVVTRRKKAKRDLFIVALLIVVIIALIAGLIVVLILQQRSVNTAGEAAAVSSVVVPTRDFFLKNLVV